MPIGQLMSWTIFRQFLVGKEIFSMQKNSSLSSFPNSKLARSIHRHWCCGIDCSTCPQLPFPHTHTFTAILINLLGSIVPPSSLSLSLFLCEDAQLWENLLTLLNRKLICLLPFHHAQLSKPMHYAHKYTHRQLELTTPLRPTLPSLTGSSRI